MYGDNPDLGLLLGPPLERLDDGVLLLSLTLGNLERLREAVILLHEGVNLLNEAGVEVTHIGGLL